MHFSTNCMHQFHGDRMRVQRINPRGHKVCTKYQSYGDRMYAQRGPILWGVYDACMVFFDRFRVSNLVLTWTPLITSSNLSDCSLHSSRSISLTVLFSFNIIPCVERNTNIILYTVGPFTSIHFSTCFRRAASFIYNSCGQGRPPFRHHPKARQMAKFSIPDLH